MTTLPTAQHATAAPTGRARSRRWRAAREGVINTSLALCAVFSLLITVAIVYVLATEAFRFFQRPEVTFTEFATGATWQPLLGSEKKFGVWPLVAGTFLVSGIAALVALPIGLITAIYLSEYAGPRVRAILKPILELLAGIPTVVYGYFALVAITPGLKSLGNFDTYNAMSAGIAVGIMCLPIVCSLSEDALRAVPRSLREGAYAVGGTRLDVSLRVVVPAALSGIIAAFLLAFARAVGETMIVALAAGSLPNLTADPRQQVQTMTGYMAQIFLGDAPAGGVEYLSCYAVAALLFLFTFGFTVAGHFVMKRFREVYQ
ncbi:MAG: phosphate ABC transporter permease subunit PstC [Planctomycetes bacterium]|nr:phosphate ABC transporter permease subunit PstC [Planctomycetota bacterium]